VSSLIDGLALAASRGVGLNFAQAQRLLPLVLQPTFVLVCFGNPLEFRLLTYGFIAESLDQVLATEREASGGESESMSAPWITRLLSPELAVPWEDDSACTFRYVVQAASGRSIAESMASDVAMLRSTVDLLQWSELF